MTAVSTGGVDQEVTDTRAPGEFLSALALLSAASSVICATLAVVVCVVRSGLGTPPSLVVTCAGLLLTTAFSPFLVPKRFRPALSELRFLSPLLMLAVAFSPLLLRHAPARLGWLYAVSGVAALLRGLPFVIAHPKRDIALVSGLSGAMGVHLFTSWAFVFVPEMLLVRVVSPDPYFHAAIVNMIRTWGIPSTGLDGAPRLRYHLGVHHWFASVGDLTGSSSSMAVMVGTALFLLPCLCLAAFVASLCLRAHRRLEPRSIVAFTVVLLLLVDGIKNDRYSYRSESEILGIIVLLLVVPLLADLVQRRRRPPPWGILRVAVLPPLVVLASFSKVSAGLLLAVGAAYTLGRVSIRTALGVATLGVIGLALVLSRSLFSSSSVDSAAVGVLGFLRHHDHAFAFLAYAVTGVFVLAVAVPWLRETRARRNAVRSGAGPSFEEVVVVVSVAAIAPTLVVGSFLSWYLLHTTLWLCLATVVSRLSGDDVKRLWQSMTTRRASPLILVLAVVILGVPLVRSFSPRDLAGTVDLMLSALATDPAAAGGRPLPDSYRRLLADSIRDDRVLFGPDFTAALRRSYGARLARAIEELAGDERRSTAVFIPPANHDFWEGAGDCQSNPFFVPAVVGIPMVAGLAPLDGSCRMGKFYSFADYPDPTSHSATLDADAICARARQRGVDRVIVIRDVDVRAANEVLGCS